eukprot:1160058-Pelagomonas_calceolata.AAC.8
MPYKQRWEIQLMSEANAFSFEDHAMFWIGRMEKQTYGGADCCPCKIKSSAELSLAVMLSLAHILGVAEDCKASHRAS